MPNEYYNLVVASLKRFSFRNYHGLTKQSATAKKKTPQRTTSIRTVTFSLLTSQLKKDIQILSCKLQKNHVKNEFSSGSPRILADFLHCSFTYNPNNYYRLNQTPFFEGVYVLRLDVHVTVWLTTS